MYPVDTAGILLYPGPAVLTADMSLQEAWGRVSENSIRYCLCFP